MHSGVLVIRMIITFSEGVYTNEQLGDSLAGLTGMNCKSRRVVKVFNYLIPLIKRCSADSELHSGTFSTALNGLQQVDNAIPVDDEFMQALLPICKRCTTQFTREDAFCL